MNPELPPEQKMSTVEDLTSQLVEGLKQSPATFHTLIWEMCRNITEFSSPIVCPEEFCTPQEFELIPEMNDVMLARVTTLGHRDKFPRPYDWENIMPTLAANEELLWIVSKKAKSQSFELYVGLKFNVQDLETPDELMNREERFQIFCDNFSRRLFPESVLTLIKSSVKGCESSADINTTALLRQCISPEMDKIFCIAGMPSPKDKDTEKIIGERKEEARPYSSLNDVLEPHINVESPFTIVFSVSSASSAQIRDSFQRKFELRDMLKPYLQQELNVSKGKNYGTGFNITPEHNTVNESKTYTRGLLPALVYGIWDTVKGKDEGSYNRHRWGGTQEKFKPSVSTTYVPEVRSESSHTDFSENLGQTIHVAHSDLIFIDKQLEQSLAHLQQAIGGGGYFASAMVYTNKDQVGESVARSLRAALSGSQTYLHPMQTFQLYGNQFSQLNCNLSAAELLLQLGMDLEVLNRDSACLSLLVPDADLPDNIKLKKSVFYGKPNMESPKAAVFLGNIAYFNDQLGFSGEFEKRGEFALSTKDLFSHLFVVGAPGGGKSVRCRHILNSIPTDVRLVVLETAKREYADLLHRPGKKVLRYTLGNSQINPLRINPFYFDEGTNLKQHIAVLADAIADLLPMEALIGPKLRESIENDYKRLGWDIESSSMLNGATPVYPDMLSFNLEVEKICAGLQDYGPEVRSNYTGALKNRSAIFLDDVYQDIFAFDGNKTLDELFPPDADVVVEMEDMPPSEINMPAFIISVLLQRIRAYRFLQRKIAKEKNRNDSVLAEQIEKSNRFLITIEEAHNVLSRKIEEGSSDEQRSGKGGQLLKQVIRLLAEGRGVGIGIMVVDQAAHAIAPSVLADTNTKIIFHQEDGEEIKTIGTSIGLDEKDWKDFQRLETGECIVKSKTSPSPVKLAPIDVDEDDYPVADETAAFSPPYIQCETLLNRVFAKGLFSTNLARKVVYKMLDICQLGGNVHAFALLRYIWGKYLYIHGDTNTLERHLRKTAISMDADELAIYLQSELMLRIKDKAVDAFLNVVNEPEENLQSIIADRGLILQGMKKFFAVMKEDFSEEEQNSIDNIENSFSEIFDRVYAADNLSIASEILREMNNNIQQTDHLAREWQALACHVCDVTDSTDWDDFDLDLDF